jgi:hypothetical protein
VARSYSQKFLLSLQEADGNRLGVRLGRLCVEANLPAAYVAKALETSRISVYNWFRGGGIREDKRKVIEVFMDLVQEDMKTGVLPASSVITAKLYIESMIGVKI